MNLEDYQPVKQLPKNLIQIPAFLAQFGEAFTVPYEKAREKNNNFKLYSGSRGGNPFIAGLVNKVFAENGGKFRTPTPSDNIYETIFPMIEDRFCIELNAFDVWQRAPNHEPNIEIWKQSYELVEKYLGRTPKGTFRIQGFYIVPNKRMGGDYQTEIIPASNFKIIEPENMPEYDGKENPLDLPTGTEFNVLDKGLIVPLDEGESGIFTKYTLGNGLSGVYFYGDGGIGSVNSCLPASIKDGRVVVINAESAPFENFSIEKYLAEIQKSYETKITKAEQIKNEAISNLEKL